MGTNHIHKTGVDKILANIKNPGILEEMYRSNKNLFKRDFLELYPQIKEEPVAGFWFERLSFDDIKTGKTTKSDIIFLTVISLVAIVIARLPSIFSIDQDYFFIRNIGFVVFPVLSIYFVKENRLSLTKWLYLAVAISLAALFINLLPGGPNGDTFVLSCIHLILFLWILTGIAFTGGKWKRPEKRLEFLKFNGDFLVMNTIIVIGGGIVTGITLTLFELIGLNIESFYFNNILITGLAITPVITTYLVRSNPNLVGRVSPVIARMFSPVVLVMLIIYLGAMLFSGRDPYNDREFLLIFNALLVGVMAIVFFSVAEDVKRNRSTAEIITLYLLAVVTIIVNLTALSAIIFRISAWGLSPNRAAVTGINLLILINLILVTVKLGKIAFNRIKIARLKPHERTTKDNIDTLQSAGVVIAAYLPVYFFWAVIVTFVFPFLF